MSMSDDFWIALGLQLVALIIWGSRLEIRVVALEKLSMAHAKHMHEMDNNGTRGMLVMVERQRAMEIAMERVEQRISDLQRSSDERLDGLREFLQQLKISVDAR